MISYTTAETKSDLDGILKLQEENLAENLDPSEIKSQGFVTVHHSFETLKKLNDMERHIIAKENEKVIGYTLAMAKQAGTLIPVLYPMFDSFNKIFYEGKKVNDYHFLVMGQVCVAKDFRGKGIFSGCYLAYREHYQKKYDFTITEIASTNTRSLHAHKNLGFEPVHTYKDPDNSEWAVVIWDWRNRNQ